MKTDTEILQAEWIATRDSLLERYVKETGKTRYDARFVDNVKKVTRQFKCLDNGLNLRKTLIEMEEDTDYHIFCEILCMYKIIEYIHFINHSINLGKEKFWGIDA